MIGTPLDGDGCGGVGMETGGGGAADEISETTGAEAGRAGMPP